jgi:hypothetical protein
MVSSLKVETKSPDRPVSPRQKGESKSMSHKSNPKSDDLGSNAIDAVNNLVEQVTALVGPAPTLSVADVRRSTKLRKGGEAVIPTVAALSEQFGLNVPSHPTADMLAKLNQAQTLIPLQKKVTTALKQINDVIFAAQSGSWADATVHYSMLKRLSRTNGDLEAAIVPVREFFARRDPAIGTAEKEQRVIRTAAKAAKAAARASAALAKNQGATASVIPAVTAAATAVTAPVTATPVTPVSSNAAQTV